MYTTKSALLNGTAQSVSASATTVVSNPIAVTSEESLRFLAKISVSAMAQTTGISFSLQDSSDSTGAVWEAVGSESSVSASKKTFTQGTAEVTDVTWPTTAGMTQGDYISVIAQDGSTFAVWLDKDAAGTAPSGVLYTAATNKIKVSIVTGGTAAQNAALARTAVLANAAWVAAFTTSTVTSATFTVTQKNGGSVTDIAPKSENDGGAGSITISVTAAGANGTTNISTNVITSTTHGFVTGQRVIYGAGTQASAPLVDGTIYYVINTGASTLSLATTLENALAGTAVDLAGYGQGTGALYAADYEIKMLVDDSSDEAQLPLWPSARVVCVTGSGDTCTVSGITVAKRK